MNRVVIFHSDKFDCVSYGNGLSYTLRDKESKRSLFVQGDDATDFRNIVELYEKAWPDMPYDEIYANVMGQLV